jgi:hypothetical protein
MSRAWFKRPSTVVFFGALFVFAVGFFVIPVLSATNYSRDGEEQEESKEVKEKKVEEFTREGHVATPEAVKGIYMSQCVVGTPTFRNSLISFIDASDLNAVVIDIKDYSGTIGFPTSDPRFENASMQSCGAGDMKEFVKSLHDKGIYVIGRITVFQDPHYSKAHPEQSVQSKSTGSPWKDHKGLNFVDVSSRDFWDYIVTLSKESIAMGFDELNYDYIRYPSDGNMSDALYKNPNKAEALEHFFVYLHGEMKPTGVVMSADLFGMTASNTDDLGIGQVLERALPYFDYVMPMVYPSHYPDGFNGYADPNDYPYEIIKYAMDRAVTRTIATQTSVRTLDGEPIMKAETIPATETTATTTRDVATGKYTKPAFDKQKIRPWLQDFDYGKEYLASDILAQTKGTYDAGITSWIFWDPSNKYDSLRAVMSE